MKHVAAPLGEIASVFNGKTPAKSDQRDEGHPVLKIKDVDDGGVFLGSFNSFVDAQFADKYKKKFIKKGDVLILNAAHNKEYVGSKLYKAADETEGALATGEWLLARSKSPKLLQSYLWCWFQNPHTRFLIKKRVKGIHLYPRDIAELQIPLPAVSEQRRIAGILDKAQHIHRARERAVAMVDELLKSTFVEMFGHPLDPAPRHTHTTLGKQCDFFAGNSLPNGVEYIGQEHGLFLLKVSDLNSPGNEKVITSAKMWAPSKESVKGGVVAPKGAIVFPKRGGAIATNKKRILGRTSVLDPNLMAVFPKRSSVISVPFLRTWFELIDLTAISSGSAVPQLNKRDLNPLRFSLPEAKQVAVFTTMSHKSAELYARLERAEADAAELFGGLSQRAFRGEL